MLKTYYYRIISMLVNSSNITYIRTVPIRPFTKNHSALQDLKNIISDLNINRDNLISAYAHNRKTHKLMELKRYIPEFYYIEEDKDAYEEYTKLRKEINKINKMKQKRLI